MLSYLFSQEPSFAPTLEHVLNPQMTAEPTELACHVTNITHLPLGGRLGVTWEHTTLPGTSAFVEIFNAFFPQKYLKTRKSYESSETYSLFSICPITCRYRGWSSDFTSRWLPGRAWQPVAGISVFWQAKERRVVSDQSPAQHIQTALPPHTGSKTESVIIMAYGNGVWFLYCYICDDQIIDGWKMSCIVCDNLA